MLSIRTISAAAVGAVAIGLSMGSVAPAEAAIITGSISGTVTSTGGAVPGVSTGNAVTGSYSYDDSVVGPGPFGGATNPFTAFSLAIGTNPHVFTLADLLDPPPPFVFGRDVNSSIPAQDLIIFGFDASALNAFVGLPSTSALPLQGFGFTLPLPAPQLYTASFPDSSRNFAFEFTATSIPTPALLPGLIGMGFAAWRKRKSEQAEQGAESAEV